jgi:hypothetical protein
MTAIVLPETAIFTAADIPVTSETGAPPPLTKRFTVPSVVSSYTLPLFDTMARGRAVTAI